MAADLTPQVLVGHLPSIPADLVRCIVWEYAKSTCHVIVRLRPDFSGDVANGLYRVEDGCTLHVQGPEEPSTVGGKPSRRQWQFRFNAVFDQSSTQQQIHHHCAGLVGQAVQGDAVTVFLYGQSGAGKRYTFEGPYERSLETSENRGLFYRCAEAIFEHIQQGQGIRSCLIFVSQPRLQTPNSTLAMAPPWN